MLKKLKSFHQIILVRNNIGLKKFVQVDFLWAYRMFLPKAIDPQISVDAVSGGLDFRQCLRSRRTLPSIRGRETT